MSSTARQRIVSRLIGAGAITPAAAAPFAPDGIEQHRVFRRLRRFGAIMEDGGRYWIDTRRLSLYRNAVRRRVALWMATSGVAATLMATAAAMTLID